MHDERFDLAEAIFSSGGATPSRWADLEHLLVEAAQQVFPGRYVEVVKPVGPGNYRMLLIENELVYAEHRPLSSALHLVFSYDTGEAEHIDINDVHVRPSGIRDSHVLPLTRSFNQLRHSLRQCLKKYVRDPGSRLPHSMHKRSAGPLLSKLTYLLTLRQMASLGHRHGLTFTCERNGFALVGNGVELRGERLAGGRLTLELFGDAAAVVKALFRQTTGNDYSLDTREAGCRNDDV